jgi:HK97 family phage portal protein
MTEKYNLSELGLMFMENGSATTVDIAYNNVGFFRRAVDIRRNGFSNMPFDFLRGSEKVADETDINDNTLDLVIDVFDILPVWATDIDLYGAAYGILLTDEFGLTGDGWVRIHPKRVQPIYGKDGMVQSWQVTAYNRVLTLPFERLLWLWQPNQTSDRGHGEPLAKAALVAAGILNHAGEFQSAFFEQGALSPTLVSIKDFYKKKPSDQNRIRDFFRRVMGGTNKAHQIHPIDGDTNVNTLQQPLKDMALSEISERQEKTISATLGVPLSLIMSNAANYATATQDDFNFYDKAVSPHAKMIADQMNVKLFEPLGYRLQYVPKRLDAYQAIELEKSETLNGMLDRNVITINEYREQMNLEPIEVAEPEEEEETQEPEIEEVEDENKPDETSELKSKLLLVQDAIKAGIPPEQAQKLVGLNLNISNSEQDKINRELKKWRKMAVKRYVEGNPDKALGFTSDIIPETLQDKIKSTLASVVSVDGVETVFTDALSYARPD